MLIANDGGIEAIIGVLRRHSGSEVVVEQAFRALANLALNGSTQEIKRERELMKSNQVTDPTCVIAH